MSRKLIVATCQHPVSADIKKNLDYLKRFIRQSVQKGADIIHFSECNLSGYAGEDFKSLNGRPESLLEQSFEKVKKLAADFKVHVIVGRHYYGKGKKKPFNSLFVIDDSGKVIHRYDKRYLMGGPEEVEQLHYSLGEKPLTFTIKDVKCGLLICHEWRYPEFYREYKKMGVELIFQSWYDGNYSSAKFKKEGKTLGEVIVGTIRSMAANNALWISASNTSMKESNFASFVIRPDGLILSKHKRNVAGVTITGIEPDKKYNDPSEYWRTLLLR
ncbi:MAG: carbon-nitrogen hydrolase family protein [Bacteroidetes bacterium]|nr:carbon-nitrogen hydrolase family protein [Bacteroidota bacterium]